MPLIFTGNRSRLLKTGQTTSYGSGTGVDDGALQKGIAKSYTVIPQVGNTNIVLNGKTDVHTNNVVFDNNTGLMWSQTLSASVGPASDGKIPWTTNANGEGVFAFCAAANAANLGNYNDWRVPNVFELASLIDYEPPNGTPDAIAFPGWTTGNVWTSTTAPDSSIAAKYIIFATGSISGAQKITNYFCALVRS